MVFQALPLPLHDGGDRESSWFLAGPTRGSRKRKAVAARAARLAVRLAARFAVRFFMSVRQTPNRFLSDTIAISARIC